MKGAIGYMHLAVLLWGGTAIIGELISLSAIWLVWWRVLLAGTGLLFLPSVRNSLRSLTKVMIKTYILIGAVLAVHWICFFGAIKLANVSVALIAMSTTASMTSILEPLLTRRAINKMDVVLALCMIPGMLLIVSDLDGKLFMGLGVGLLSAFLAGLFSILNKINIHDKPPLTITFLQIVGVWIFISVLIPILVWSEYITIETPLFSDYLWLVILAGPCTIVAFLCFLKGLQHISAYFSNLIINLEPVYGILMAAVFFREYEQLNASFYLGLAVILGVIFSYSYIKTRYERDPNMPKALSE